MADTQTLHRDPAQALGEYLRELELKYVPWYESAVRRNYAAWMIVQAVGVFASFGSALLAALLRDDNFKGFQAGRIALIVLPIVASFAASFLGQVKLRELVALRDAGREAIVSLVERARATYPAVAEDGTAVAALHAKLVEDVSQVERTQAFSWLGSNAKPS